MPRILVFLVAVLAIGGLAPAAASPAPLSRPRRPPHRRLAPSAASPVVRAASPVPPTATRPPLPPVAPDDFYLLDPVPSGPSGELLRSVELFAPDGLRQWAILYRSTGLDGEPIAVSGLVLAPAGPVAEPRPVLGLAHGTTGLNDTCAPSRSTTGRVELIVAGLPAAVDGWVVVATDYAGLGTPGPHPYLDGPSEGRAVLHGILAAQQLPEAGAGTTVGLQGISQGGHATLWAAELPPRRPQRSTWSGPSLPLPRATCASPPIGRARRRPAANRGSTPWRSRSRGATSTAFPLDQLLVPEAAALAPRLETECRVEPEVQPLRLDVPISPEWAAMLERNTAGHAPSSAPILYLQGTADPQIPLASARALVERLCAIGTVVEYRELDGVDHAGALYAGDRLGAARGWLDERLTGTPPTDSCPAA